MKKIILLALIFRLIIAPWIYHPDVLDQLNWSKNISEYGLNGFYFRDSPDAGPPNYPPLYYLYLYTNNTVYDFGKGVLWSLNNHVKIFPSNIFLWYESDQGRINFNKLIPIFCDIGIGYLVYLISKIISDSKKAKWSMILYLFLPPSWYISSVWGQTDSIYILFVLISGYYLIKKKVGLTVIFYGLSMMIKPLSVFLLPAFALYLVRIGNYKKIFQYSFITIITFFIIHLPFGISIYPSSLLSFYQHNIREILGYISANAFNLWGMIYGFGPISDNRKLFGISVFNWGIFLFVSFLSYYLMRSSIMIDSKNLRTEVRGFIIGSSKSIFYTLLLVSYSSFLFMSRVHERYFYLPFVLILVIFASEKKLKYVVVVSTLLFLINLYHYWWMPFNGQLKILLSNRLIEISFCLINIMIFVFINRILGKSIRHD